MESYGTPHQKPMASISGIAAQMAPVSQNFQPVGFMNEALLIAIEAIACEKAEGIYSANR